MRLKTCTIVKFNKAQSYLFEKIKLIKTPKKKLEKVQVTNISHDEGKIITDSVDVKKIIIAYY